MENRSINTKKITILYSAAFALYFGAFCTIRSFISVYLLDRGFSYTRLGIITGIHMFCSAFVQPFFGQVLNRFPRLRLRKFLLICFIPTILCSLLTFFLPARMIFFIPLYIIFGLFEIGVQALMVSFGMAYVNAGIPLNTGVGRGFGSVGYAIFNMLLGMMIVRFGSSVSHILNIILLVLLCALIITMPDPEAPESAEDAGTGQDREPAESLFTFLRNEPVFLVFSISVTFIFFGHCIINTYMPNVAGQFGLGSDFTGMMNALAACLELIPMMLYTRISKRFTPFAILRVSAVFFVIKILTATLAKSGAGIAFSQSMQILAYAPFAMASMYFTNEAVKPRSRVMAQGLLVGMNEAGFMIGGLTGGIVLDHSGIRTLLWLGVAMTVIGSALMLRAVGEFEKRQKMKNSRLSVGN